jgi:hypothetical protein
MANKLPNVAHVCFLCGSRHGNERLLDRHIILSHWEQSAPVGCYTYICWCGFAVSRWRLKELGYSVAGHTGEDAVTHYMQHLLRETGEQ